MTGTPDDSIQWRRTTILLRTDLFEKAREKNLDIGHVCNQAVAGVLGIDLAKPKKKENSVSQPVMVAPDTVPVAPIEPGHDADRSLHPVVNANDPAAVRSMLKAGRKARVVPEAPPALTPVQELVQPTIKPAPAKKKRSTASSSGKKEDPIKKFIADMVIRGEPDDVVLPKDELYDHFVRWCNEKRIRQVPDKKRFVVSLKTQYAFIEKNIGGVACWLNVRLNKQE